MLVTRTWRAYRRASRRAGELSTYFDEQATELDRLAGLLNEHGFELEHTAADLAPKLQLMSAFMSRPLVAATIPWIIRRTLGRPYRRR